MGSGETKINPSSATCREIYENGLKAGSNPTTPLFMAISPKANHLISPGNSGGSDETRTRDLRRDRPAF